MKYIIYLLCIFLVSCQVEKSNDTTERINSAPVIKDMDTVIIPKAVTKQLEIEILDNENDVVTTSWLVLETPDLATLNITVTQMNHIVEINADTLGDYIIQVDAFDGENIISKKINIEVINTPPQYENFKVENKYFWYSESYDEYFSIYDGDPVSSEVNANSSLIASFDSVTDENDDPLSITYHWFVNNEAVKNNAEHEDIILLTEFENVTTVSVYAIISDGYTTTTTDELFFDISNSEPYFYGATLTQEADTNVDLYYEIQGLFDPDGDELTIQYYWNINGVDINNNSDILLAEHTKAGDSVSVYAQIDDTEHSITTFTSSAIILDSEATSMISDLPERINHNETWSFTVEINDADLGENEIVLAYGPSGMAVDLEGNGSWTPNEIMFSAQEQFNFAFKQKNSEALFEYSVIVVDESRTPIIARSSLDLPKVDGSFIYGDFDDDDENEFLVTDNGQLLYTMAYQDDTFVQKWLHPYSLEINSSIKKLLKLDLDNNNKDEFVVLTTKSLWYFKTLNKVEALHFDNGVLNIDNDYEVIDISINDINNDDQLDLVALVEINDITTLVAYDLISKQQLFDTTLPNSHEMILVDNFDLDPQLEIIVDSNLMFDGLSGANQKIMDSTLEDIHVSGDINNDGVSELIQFKGRNIGVSILNVLDDSEIIIDLDNVCSLTLANVNDTPEQELLIGGCESFDDFEVYDITSQLPVVLKTWDRIRIESNNVLVANIDEDDSNEIIWTSNAGDTKSFVIADINDVNPTYDASYLTLEDLIACGPLVGELDNNEVVFVATQSEAISRYDDSQRVLKIDELGRVTASDEISENSKNLRDCNITDIENDGASELLLATSDSSGVKLEVLNLSDFSSTYLPYTGERYINTIKTAKYNDDEFVDGVFFDDYNLKFYDFYNSEIIAGIAYRYSDFILPSTTDGVPTVLTVSTNNDELVLWRKNGKYFTKEYSTDSLCSKVQTIQLIDSSSDSFICFDYSEYNQSYFSIYDSQLNLIHTFSVDGNVIDFVVEKQENGAQNILITHSYFGYLSLKLISIDAGSVIWQSPMLLGETNFDQNLFYIPNQNGNKRITFAMYDTMYLTK